MKPFPLQSFRQTFQYIQIQWVIEMSDNYTDDPRLLGNQCARNSIRSIAEFFLLLQVPLIEFCPKRSRPGVKVRLTADCDTFASLATSSDVIFFCTIDRTQLSIYLQYRPQFHPVGIRLVGSFMLIIQVATVFDWVIQLI